ncbi:MAG TPA: response regulator transcription factor [Cytophagaceae bacterium]|jgi:two-component system alkaline phosphatase synthesis response regulator PhoP|nr:response regulator transcription factor [Cytophagaceae bacterium]
MSKKNKVLIADDEQDILDMLQYILEKEGYEVKIAKSGPEAIRIAQEFQPRLILLDIMMPQMDGIETCRNLRELDELKDTVIVFLTARSEEYSEIAAFESGANDYIVKPIKPRALVSRIASYFRKEVVSKKNAIISINDLVIDKTSYTVTVADKKITLAKKEFELLYFLCQHPNKIFNRDDILKRVWGTDVYVVSRTVDVHIRKIREKVGEHYISTVKGIGYKFETGE